MPFQRLKHIVLAAERACFAKTASIDAVAMSHPRKCLYGAIYAQKGSIITFFSYVCTEAQCLFTQKLCNVCSIDYVNRR